MTDPNHPDKLIGAHLPSTIMWGCSAIAGLLFVVVVIARGVLP